MIRSTSSSMRIANSFAIVSSDESQRTRSCQISWVGVKNFNANPETGTLEDPSGRVNTYFGCWTSLMSVLTLALKCLKGSCTHLWIVRSIVRQLIDGPHLDEAEGVS